MPKNTVAFQGLTGAYSDLACRAMYPELKTMPCPTFHDALSAVREGRADKAMIPVENSAFGRVADIHYMLPESGLHIVGEHFQPVHHCLLALPGTDPAQIQQVHSHPQALGQCSGGIRRLGLTPVPQLDTAGSAKDLSKSQNPEHAAIASALAAKVYGLEVLENHFEDNSGNTTRFLVMAREPLDPEPAKKDQTILTTFVFQVRNIPAALYKAMGGFATNGINMIKLESYMLGGTFVATQFYCDVEGSPKERNLRLALEELGFFARDVQILGVYPAHEYRKTHAPPGGDD